MSKEEAAVWSCSITHRHAGVPKQKSPSLQDVMHLRVTAVSTVSQQEFRSKKLTIPDHKQSQNTSYYWDESVYLSGRMHHTSVK